MKFTIAILAAASALQVKEGQFMLGPGNESVSIWSQLRSKYIMAQTK